MMNRRHILQAAAGLAALPVLSTAARADWKADYPELVFATIPDENATGVEKRYEPFIQYLTKQLGVPVKLRIANDYAAVIEGQIAENIDIALYGPSSFARALMNGAKIDAFAMQVNQDGTKAYYSVMYVKADAPYTKLEDLKGKNLGLVDPNSTSGNNVPRFEMNKLGIKPEEFFSNVVYTGSHENAIIALQQGQVDAVFNAWNDENESNLRRMERKGMAKYDDFKIIFKSEPIVNSPFAMLTKLPAELQTAIKDAFFSIEKNDPEAFQVMTDGKQQLWVPTNNEAYAGIVELNKFVDTLRKS
ncbi:MAG: phosphonate ABC transporter substrate-binding protein [Aestuariivirga sp.]|jgi:phosphonate transport system substrate-binding protein|uniref:phosphonate ABC transporter substrate-binding protein n=1 Tax=Aestuariivirga sp. TaxID=2650926 RepID=UPI003018B5D3